MLGEFFLLKFLTSLFGLFLSFTFVYLPIILAIIAYRRKWGIKKFLKRVVESVTLIITTIIVVVGVLVLLGHFTEIKDPVEEMINNPQKYKNMPCFEVEFNKEKYCFDRSRAYIENKYVSRTTGEDESAEIYFIPRILSNFPIEHREVRVYLKVDKHHRDDVNEPEYFVRGAVKDDSREGKVFKKLIDKAKDGEFVEITKMLKSDWLHGGKKHFTVIFNSRIVLSLIATSNKYFKFIGQTTFQSPIQAIYFEFQLVSNQSTQQEFLKTLLDVAQEFNQFLTDSKVSNQPLSTNSTTN
ncbi:MAG: hypothetical protein V4694_03815 [Pseudomonadota bacterium]